MWVTPPLGTRGPALAANTIPPLSVWPCGTRFSNTQEGQERCRSAPITDPLFRGLGIPNRSPDPWYNGRAGITPSRYSPDLPWRERDLARRVGHGIEGHRLSSLVLSAVRHGRYLRQIIMTRDPPPRQHQQQQVTTQRGRKGMLWRLSSRHFTPKRPDIRGKDTYCRRKRGLL